MRPYSDHAQKGALAIRKEVVFRRRRGYIGRRPGNRTPCKYWVREVVSERTRFAAALAAIAAVGLALFATAPRRMTEFAGDNREDYADAADRHTLAAIFDPFLVTASPGANTYYSPVRAAIWAAMVAACGLRPAFFCWVGVLIHLLAALLVAALARALLASTGAALIAGLLFVGYYPSHPTPTFVAAMFSHGACVVLYLAGMLAFVRFLQGRRRRLSYGVALAFFTLAQFTKETGWSMLPAMAALEFFVFLPPERKRPTLANLASFVNKYYPFFFAWLASFAIFILKYPYGSIGAEWGGAGLSINAAFRFFDMLTYMICPTIPPAMVKLALVNATIFLFAGVAAYGSPLLRALFFWLAAALAAYCLADFRPIDHIVRYLYLPSAALALIVAAAAVAAWKKRRLWRWTAGGAVALALAANLAGSAQDLWR
jgi:hypothetical protein